MEVGKQSGQPESPSFCNFRAVAMPFWLRLSVAPVGLLKSIH